MSDALAANVKGEAAPDRDMIARVAGGDADALAALYDRHARLVFTLALRIVREVHDAEDVVQEVFTQVWRQAARYDHDRATVAGWLLMIARARAIDRLRSRRARPDTTIEAPLPDMPSDDLGQEVNLLHKEEATRMRAALDELGDTLRTPLELAYFEGLTQSAIATRLGQPLGTVKARTRSALMKLRAALQPEGGQ